MADRMLKMRWLARAGVLAACLVLTGAMAADVPGVLHSLRVWDRVEVTVSPDVQQATRLDIVLVAALRSPAEAALYAAASRFARC